MNGMYSNVTVQTSLLRAVFRDYSFPDDWEECWRRLKGKILYVQTSLASPHFGIIRFRQLETFATGSTTNLFVGNF